MSKLAKLDKWQERILKGENPKLRINLKSIFGQSITNDVLKESIIGDAIEMIRERTDSGRDRNGNAFKPYSKMYRNSLDFKAFGKSSSVNLKLTGDMMSAMDRVGEKGDAVEIGFVDELEASKAHGHITGGGNLPVRDFFGLTEKEINQLKSRYEDQIERTEGGIANKIFQAIERIRGEG